MPGRAAKSWRVLVCVLPVLVLAACGGDAPRVPTTLAPPSNTTSTGPVAAAVATVPTVTVTDQKGRGLAGVWVKWTVVSGGGHVGNDSSQTDGSGVSSSGGWTLGTTLGAQTLTASANKLTTTTFTAQAVAGPLSSLIQWSPAITAVVGTAVATPPSVRAFDAYGNPIAGVPVTFAVATGGGTVTGAQQTTNADGLATATGWTLGTAAGDQTIRASSGAVVTSVIVHSIGSAPAQITVSDGNAQNGYAGRRLCTSPSVKLLDIYGNAAAQVPVVFTPASGSGSVTGGTVITDSSGTAVVGGWILSSGAQQTLIATSPVLAGKSASFTVTVVPAASFSICARFIGTGGTARQRLAVTRAVARWQSVITGHIQTTHITAPASACTSGIPAVPVDEDVEDLLLYVQLAPIDGPLAILGQASPCYIHLPANLTLMGFLQLDTADLDLLLTDGTLDNVVLHEIGHILGIGTLWNYQRNLLFGAGTSDPYFGGATARDAFVLTGSNYPGNTVPVENLGGAGTRDSHWRKSVFDTELMQGFANPFMPLSRVTIASLADLGYQVNLAAADPFSLAPASLRSADSPVGMEMVNDIADTPIWGVSKNGTKTLLRVPSAAALLRKR